jgi:hypothetical protein
MKVMASRGEYCNLLGITSPNPIVVNEKKLKKKKMGL